MFKLIIIAFIGFCLYKAYALHKAKKHRQESKPVELPVPKQIKTPEQELEEEQAYHDKIRRAVSARTGVALSRNTAPELSGDLPQIGSIQRALYEMERQQADEKQAEIERKTAAERELERSESARRALRAVNEKKKADSRTKYYDPWDDEIDDELTCFIRYTNEIGESSARHIKPINVRLNKAGNWTVFAFDHSVSESRTFRIDRIVYLEHKDDLYTDFDEILKFLKSIT
ncbi:MULTISPECIES: WYL domain-containing protein [Moraxella]|uniref:WYL domain-containing protein n=1 Tax=Moraxella catarrhalis TaxID=480 RepID=A0A7Z0UXS3_MORCA|nr:WYL domain-containing protein [Moraxella catarrhalis]OAV00248.1 hypothetical protein AO382_1398 [Moraxella catarrhalis]STY82516.1 Uncharacterised protein [Moraxella catarrhalis]